MPIAGTLISDTMTSGLYHYYINITQHNIHEKFAFIYINNVRRTFLEMKKHISAYHRMYVPVERIDQFIHSYMVRCIIKKECYYHFMLKAMRDYYNYQLDIYLTRYND